MGLRYLSPLKSGSSGGFVDLKSIQVDGVNDYAAPASPTSFDFAKGDPFTLMGWFYITSLAASPNLFGNAANSAPYQGYTLFIRPNGSVEWNWIKTYPTNGLSIRSATGVIASNSWSHMAVTSQGGTANTTVVYVNGVAVIDIANSIGTNVQNNLSGTLTGNGVPFQLGIAQGGAFPGYADDFYISTTSVLTPSAIAAVYNLGVPKDERGTSGLTNGWWMGDAPGDGGTLITDVIGAIDMTLFNGASIVSAHP